MTSFEPNGPEQALVIPVDTVCFIIGKLRAYENTDLLAEEAEDQPNLLETGNVDVFDERENPYRYQPVLQELESFIGDLPEDQQIDLVALMWLGRDNYSAADWLTVREEAAQAHNARTVSYLLGSPLASDFLEEGLSTLGLSCEDTNAEEP